jgi:hypothetical protein
MKNHHRKSTAVKGHRKPKMYRSKSTDRTSDIADWNPSGDNAGGNVKGVIIGPKTSVGDVDSHPSTDQGNKKGIEVV